MDLQKKPTPKKAFSLNDFKKKINNQDTPDKELQWIKLSPAFQEVTGLPGIPKGYLTLFRGFSNTGKSTSISEAIVSAQKMGILPVIIDLENNLSRDRLKLMGFDWDSDFFIEVDNEYLLEKFGKAKDATKKEASIEDMGDCINFFLDKQESGELPYELFFAIDSIGVLDCDMAIKAKSNDTNSNNMWGAGALERSLKGIINYRIPGSRKTSKQYTNTLACVQKIWLEPQSVGMPVIRHKGGNSLLYATRLLIHHGGKLTQGCKIISATSKKREIAYGIETVIEVVKNHLGSEKYGGISLQGKLISTPHGFIGNSPEQIAEYKKNNLTYFRDKLEVENAEDISIKYEEGSETSIDEINDMITNAGK